MFKEEYIAVSWYRCVRIQKQGKASQWNCPELEGRMEKPMQHKHRARGVPCKVENHRYKCGPGSLHRAQEFIGVRKHFSAAATSRTHQVLRWRNSQLQGKSRAGGGGDRDGEVNELEGAMLGGRIEVFVDASLPVAAVRSSAK
ncbi:hypothetical protein B0H14DRAFT_2571910 [Mycena olivaceomarginata]|nr:hypothetical protein B0H14DRAFT_2571910 [Mycena olivaceomarginata]